MPFATDSPTPQAPPSAAAPKGPALRSFGRFRLLRLLGRSDRTMAWLVGDPRTQRDLVLVLPRTQVTDAASAQRWAQAVRKAARLQHPNLAPPIEIGVHDGWPFAAYDTDGCATLSDRWSGQGLPANEAVALTSQVLLGLAYAHDAGVAHHDLQPYLVFVDDTGRVRLVGLEVTIAGVGGHEVGRGASGVEHGALHAQRNAAETDVLAAGLILHQALSGQPPLDEKDIGRVVEQLPPMGHQLVRLPWSTTHPVPEVLRAIANRAADRQERQRYRNARTFQRALDGWLASVEGHGDGALAMLLERLSSVGLLPAAPGSADRAARLALMDRQRTNELAATVIDDLALTFEMLRLVNAAQLRSGNVTGAGPVLTMRRAIAMLGLDGVRRAALSLRAWPGAANEAAAAELARLVAQVKRAGRIAVLIRPSGYDAEVVYVITLLQNLGRLVVQYHAADEAAQIRRLMAPAPPEKPGEPAQPGMSEEAAAYSVIGVDIESIGLAVARRWGVDDQTLQTLRRLPAQAPLHAPDSDGELLRWVASCANDLVDLQSLPAREQVPALQRLAQRYARALHLLPKDYQEVLQEAATASTMDLLLADTGNALFLASQVMADIPPMAAAGH